MKSGYKVFWTPNAKKELMKTIDYLNLNFTEKEIIKLVQKIDSTIELISKNPNVFPKSEFKNIHKTVILKFNTMYYQVKDDNVEILSFFSNRQSPNNRKV